MEEDHTSWNPYADPPPRDAAGRAGHHGSAKRAVDDFADPAADSGEHTVPGEMHPMSPPAQRTVTIDLLGEPVSPGDGGAGPYDAGVPLAAPAPPPTLGGGVYTAGVPLRWSSDSPVPAALTTSSLAAEEGNPDGEGPLDCWLSGLDT